MPGVAGMQALFITHFANGTRLPPAKVYETEKLPPAAPQVDVEGGDFDDGPGSTPQVHLKNAEYSLGSFGTSVTSAPVMACLRLKMACSSFTSAAK